jgi:hypothetical protein
MNIYINSNTDKINLPKVTIYYSNSADSGEFRPVFPYENFDEVKSIIDK